MPKSQDFVSQTTNQSPDMTTQAVVVTIITVHDAYMVTKDPNLIHY